MLFLERNAYSLWRDEGLIATLFCTGAGSVLAPINFNPEGRCYFAAAFFIQQARTPDAPAIALVSVSTQMCCVALCDFGPCNDRTIAGYNSSAKRFHRQAGKSSL
jgi:hypothetical protein